MVKCNLQETICTKLIRHCEDNIRTILPPMTNLAIMRAATSASCFSSCVLHCLLVGLAYPRITKNLFETCLCQTPVGRGHRKNEPRSVGVLANAHGMTLLLQRTETPEPQLHMCTSASCFHLSICVAELIVALGWSEWRMDISDW